MIKRLLTIVFCIICIKLHAQTTQNFSAANDNSIYSDFVNNSNGVGENLFCGQTAVGGNRRLLLKIDFSGVTPGGGYAVSSATLKLYCNLSAPAGGPADIKVVKLTNTWGEGTSDAAGAEGRGAPASINDATWNARFFNTTLWTNPGGDFAAGFSAVTSVNTSGITYTWSSPDLITDVQNWMNGTATNYGWILIGDEATTSSAKRFASRENADPSLRPVLEVTYSVTPVKLVSFTAQQQSGGIQLQWQTAQEYNNDYFTIEHSTDGIRFNAVGTVRGAGFSQIMQNYNFLHRGNFSGTHFYRLVQTDLDGKKTLSPVIHINLPIKNTEKLLAVNHTSSVLVLNTGLASVGSNYTILNSAGAMVAAGRTNGNSLDISGLVSGLYIIRLKKASGDIVTDRFVKQ